MDYLNQIRDYVPLNEQEESDKNIILEYSYLCPDVLTRENKIAHITSSGFIVNSKTDKVLLIHHNIRNVWAWTGGHADGESDLLSVAVKEAREETGVDKIDILSPEIASLDILTNEGHFKNKEYVSAHLHLSVAFILVCNENEKLTEKPDENSGVKWFGFDFINSDNFSDGDCYLYNKLINKAVAFRDCGKY
jgi:8-oxo-dGTP pyrophosphatase MutT (NUDIX family)